MNNEKIYGVVLVGCGHIGEQHISDIYYRDNIKIIATVDFNIETAKSFARKYSGGHKVEYGTDYREFLSRPDVDIFIVATYANTHFEIMKACVEHGKHVLCEKPIATTVEKAKEFCDVVRNSHSKVLIAHILRHNAMYQKARELIRNGVIGDVRVIRMCQNHHILDRDRYMNLLSDCSPIVDCGVHYVDVVRWLTGLEITSVSGNGAVIDNTIPKGAYDYGMILMGLSNGGTACYEASWSETMKSENLKEFVGTKGRIRMTLGEFRSEDREEGNLIEIYDNETKEYRQINLQGQYKDMYSQLMCLIDMIENNTDGDPTLEDAMEAFRIVTESDKIIRKKLGL